MNRKEERLAQIVRALRDLPERHKYPEDYGIRGVDWEAIHGRADKLLLEALHLTGASQVAEAYNELFEGGGHWCG